MNGFLSLQDVADVLNLPLPSRLSPETRVTGASIDSRNTKPGDLFFGIEGQRLNGAEYCAQAIANGAVACVTLAAKPEPFTFTVDSIELALAHLADAVRKRSNAVWIGITGSVGKTTTRRVLAAILNQISPTHESPHNYNNFLGVPLTILNTAPADEFVVVEIGTSMFGEVRLLGDLVRPNIAIVTAVEPAHLEGIGSLEYVCDEKLSLFTRVEPGGRGFVPSEIESAWPDNLAEFRKCAAIETVDSVDSVTCDENGSFVRIDDIDFRVPQMWGQSLGTILPLARAAAQSIAAVDDAAVQNALNTVQPPDRRCRVIPYGRSIIIDDTYNANPASVRNALALLGDTAWGERERLAVLGEMAELGTTSREAHNEIALLADEIADQVLLIGDRRSDWPKETGSATSHVNDTQMVVDHITNFAAGDTVLLVKGSRRTSMDAIVKKLLETPPKQPHVS